MCIAAQYLHGVPSSETLQQCIAMTGELPQLASGTQMQSHCNLPTLAARSYLCVRLAGLALSVEERMMDAVTGLSGSGPAYVFMMVEALADGAVAAGLPRDKAMALAAQTVAGAARMVSLSNLHWLEHDSCSTCVLSQTATFAA